MKRVFILVLVGGFWVCTCLSFGQYAEKAYYDSVTASFKKRCSEEGRESCLNFLLKDQDKYTRQEILKRLTDAEKDQIDAYVKAKAEAAEKAARREAEARQRAAEMQQRQAEAKQQAIFHHERMQELERQRRALNRLRLEIMKARRQQRQQRF